MTGNALEFLDEADTLETIAAVEHQRWAHWQQYLHDQCTAGEDGSLIIPAQLVMKWKHQIEAPYTELSDEEKESDREQAREYIAALRRVVENSLIQPEPPSR